MASEQMENLKQVMTQMISAGFTPKFDGRLDPFHLRSVVRAAQEQMATEPGVSFLQKKYAGIEAEWSIPDSAQNDYLIFYIHGGGFICGDAFTSRGYASVLAKESGRKVLSVSYPLSPEHPYPAAVDACFAVYQAVIHEYPRLPVFLIGESAGACLSAVTAIKARDAGISQPAGIALYSCPIDFSGMIDRDFPGNQDFTITPNGLNALAELYCKTDERKNPYVSPYFANYTGLCPVFLAWDENESLAKDSEELLKKAEAAGVNIVWKSYPNCFHAFATAGKGTPESYAVMKETVAFFDAQAQLHDHSQLYSQNVSL